MVFGIWFEEDSVSKGSAWVLDQKLNQLANDKAS